MKESNVLSISPSVFKSVAESNKQSGNKIISSTIQSNIEIDHSLPVTRLETFDIENAKKLQEGVYLITKYSNSLEKSHFAVFLDISLP